MPKRCCPGQSGGVPEKEVVLILQIGSLGDTVVALPCYREIARRHPRADRYLVTNFPIGSKMVPAAAVLAAAGAIAGSIDYPMPLRTPRRILEVRRKIIALRPAVLYYLLPEVKTLKLVRHYAFFKLCGIPNIRGMPWSRELRTPRELDPGRLWESEASRLLRCLGAPSGPPADEDRDLALTAQEHARAGRLLASLGEEFIAVSAGGKVPVNDWGDANWCHTLAALSGRMPGLGVVFVGSMDERTRNDTLAAAWAGPSLNACGLLSPRETAALIACAQMFLGHDTGTLHLAAAVNTPVVGIFSARNRPGKWFSDRARDRFFYRHISCAGCELVAREDCPHELACMATHDPEAVAEAVAQALAAPPRGGQNLPPDRAGLADDAMIEPVGAAGQPVDLTAERP